MRAVDDAPHHGGGHEGAVEEGGMGTGHLAVILGFLGGVCWGRFHWLWLGFEVGKVVGRVGAQPVKIWFPCSPSPPSQTAVSWRTKKALCLTSPC